MKYIYQTKNNKLPNCGVISLLNAYKFWYKKPVKQKLKKYNKLFKIQNGTSIQDLFVIASQLKLNLMPIQPHIDNFKQALSCNLPILLSAYFPKYRNGYHTVFIKNINQDNTIKVNNLARNTQFVNVNFNTDIILQNYIRDNIQIPWQSSYVIIPEKFSISKIKLNTFSSNMWKDLSQIIYNKSSTTI